MCFVCQNTWTLRIHRNFARLKVFWVVKYCQYFVRIPKPKWRLSNRWEMLLYKNGSRKYLEWEQKWCDIHNTNHSLLVCHYFVQVSKESDKSPNFGVPFSANTPIIIPFKKGKTILKAFHPFLAKTYYWDIFGISWSVLKTCVSAQ